MTVAQEVLNPTTSAIVELFKLDCSTLGQGVFYFSNQVNRLGVPLIFDGVSYQPIPITGAGWKKSMSGAAPRPRLTIDNSSRVLQAAMIAAGDLVGCVVTRTRVFEKYIDAVNFIDGINLTADPSQTLSTDVYVINSKTAHNNKIVEFELCWALDIPGKKLPAKLVLRDFGFPGAGLNR